MKVALVVFTDGRFQCLERTLYTLDQCVDYRFDYLIAIDDSADPEYGAAADTILPGWTVVHNEHRYGFCGAVDRGWRSVPEDATHVFHLEDDFQFECPVDIEAMGRVLDARPYLVQLALKRQPWNDEERAAGDLVWGRPEDFIEHTDGLGHYWVEHRNYFTTNPSLMAAHWVRGGMPLVPECEGKFGITLKADPANRFAYWGRFADPPRVTHIGNERVGNGY